MPSRIIKAPADRVLPAEVVDAQSRARDALAAAERRATEIIAGAEAAHAEARREGFAAGREEGLAALTELLVRARVVAAQRDADAAPELRRLAVRIAEKIIGRELALTPDAVVDVVRAALEAARARRELVVRVHPDDLAAVTGAHARLAGALLPQAQLAVRADATIALGGCQIDTEVGTIDARLEVQLAAIERALTTAG